MRKYWDDYVLLKNKECETYFDKKLDEHILFILGAGFDERMCEGIKKIGIIAKSMDVWLIRFEEAPNSDSLKYSKRVDENLEVLYGLVSADKIHEKEIKMWNTSGENERPVSDPNSAKFINNNIDELQKYDSIVVDVSALPQNIYFILLDKLLYNFYEKKKIYIMACENYVIDQKTNPVGIDEHAHYFMGYGATGNVNEDKPVIWLPVLGECDKTRLERCYDYIMQNAEYQEICPMVPFPSINERRADEILVKFHKQLFDTWRIEKKNIIYASETNPFQVYRRICETVEHYSNVLQPLNNDNQDATQSCRFVFTALTSKLMAIGTFLAAFNLKKENYIINIAGLYNRGYKVKGASSGTSTIQSENVVYCLCLSDEGI